MMSMWGKLAEFIILSAIMLLQQRPATNSKRAAKAWQGRASHVQAWDAATRIVSDGTKRAGQEGW
jgi:hypothetical protein